MCCSHRSLPPAIEFPKLGCAAIQTGLEVGVRFCSQGTRGSSLRLLHGRFTLAVGESPSWKMWIGLPRAGEFPGALWAYWDLAAAGTHLRGPFPNLKGPWGQGHGWVKLLGFGTNCKDAALGISGRERGNTKEMWRLINLFLSFTLPSHCSWSGEIIYATLGWACL